MAFPSVDQLVLELTAGQGVAVIVEGDSDEDDPYFYRRWFGDRAGAVSFFPQNGWPQVVAAVTELRQKLSGIPVYGLIDRDFCEDHELDGDFATLGLLRMPRYTLENYLLDPQCWADTFKLIFSRNRAAAQGWDEAPQIDALIAEAYRKCCGLAAHNWVVKSINSLYETQPGFAAREYLRHFRHFSDAEAVLTKLQAWGTQLGVNEDLKEMFASRLTKLQAQSQELQHCQISGKYVLQYLHQRSPLPPAKKRHPLDHLLDLYLDRCPAPPPDLIKLIDRIVTHAQQ